MEVIKFISGQFCGRCHTLEPYLKQFCEENWYILERKDISEASKEELGSATMLPIVWFWDEQLDYDETLSRITKS
jgi:hypothetical protein